MLWIEPRGKDFAIVRACADGGKRELVLSELGLIGLARMLPQALETIHARRRTPHLDKHGIVPIHAILATDVDINTDLPKRKVLVSFVDQFGNKAGYALAPDMARHVGEGLLTRVASMT
jgi:hypothetical protein